MSNDIYNDDTGMLSLTSDAMEVAFEVATRQAIENNKDVFDFDGYTIETAIAIDVIQAMKNQRTYH